MNGFRRYSRHLGLIREIEHIYGHRLKVVDCPKCAAFWATLVYGLWAIRPFYGEYILILAISFLASYTALWLELIEGFIDVLYDKVYEKIYREPTDNAPAAGPDEADTAGSMPEL